MEWITEILKSPLVQGFGILLLGGLGQKMGIPVVDIAKKLLGINGGNGKEIESLNNSNDSSNFFTENSKDFNVSRIQTKSYLSDMFSSSHNSPKK